MLEVKDLRTLHGRKIEALRGVSLTVMPGEIVALIGGNGAGKSTLIKVLTGAIRPDAGRITMGGDTVEFRDPEHARALGIAAVYQEPMVYPHLTVLENIFAGREICNRFGMVRHQPMVERVRPWLAALNLPEAVLHRPISTLGLGHVQLVLIAQALVQEARVIILDEPTSILSRADRAIARRQ